MTGRDDMTRVHDDVQSLLGAHALHAVEPDEAEAIEAHVAACPRCRAELDGYLRSAPLLGSVADEPPEGLWSEIRTTIGDHRTEAVPLQIRRALGRRHRWTSGSAVAAAAALVVALAATVGVLVSGSPGTPGQRVRDAARAALAGPHTLTELRAPGGAALAEVVVVRGTDGFFVPIALRDLPAGRTYQLWASVRGTAVSLGTVGGRAQVVSLHVDRSMRAFMLTAEPAGGVVQPDGAVLAAGAVPA